MNETRRDLERRAEVEQSRLMRTLDALTHHRLVHAAVERLNPRARHARPRPTRWRIVLLSAIAGLAAFAFVRSIEHFVARRRRAIS